MYISHCDVDGEWGKGEIQPFGPLQLSPSAGILNYGQVCTKKGTFIF
jgi:branched-chain amino acid aminotransferase